MNELHLSLSQLIKQSAMQTCYLRKNNKAKPVTKAMIQGNDIAIDKSESEYVEMRGTYNHDNLLIHYAFDEVNVNDVSALLIEHKNITSGSPVEMWYFEYSILQTAVYQAFAQVNRNTKLQTATFYTNKGNPKLELDFGNLYLRSELRMDNRAYTVIATDAKKLVKFYCEKAVATLNYNDAKEFDLKYKHQEYKKLQECLSFRPVKLEYATET